MNNRSTVSTMALLCVSVFVRMHVCVSVCVHVLCVCMCV